MENTTNGPAGSNSPAMPVTPHETHGHLDDNADGWAAKGAPGDDFSWSGTGPLKPINP